MSKTSQTSAIPDATLYSAARLVAFLAGAFSLAVATLLILNHLQSISADPLNSPALLKLLEQTAAQPQNVALREEVRAFDLLARRAFFSSQHFNQTGALLLFGGAALLLAALGAMQRMKRALPRPPTVPYDPAQGSSENGVRRWALAAGTFVATIGGLAWFNLSPWLNFTAQTKVTTAALTSSSPTIQAAPSGSPTPSTTAPSSAAAVFPSDEEIRRNWPNLRGPYNQGVATATAPPDKWDVAAGTGVLWKTESPTRGFSSPVIWNDKLFLTGGTAENLEVCCVSTADGKLLWRKSVQRPPNAPEPPEVQEDTGYAAPTPATDGQHLCAIFATGDVVAFDFDGRQVWVKSLGVPDNSDGHGSSLLFYRDLLIVQYDQAEKGNLYAFRSKDGSQAWHVARKVDPSWASPALARHGNLDDLVINASPEVHAYDPLDGKQRWHLDCMAGEIAVSPAVFQNIVFCGNEGGALTAIDLEKGQQLWMCEDELPDVSSPVAHEGLLYMPTSYGMFTCLDAKTGEKVWQQEFDEGFYSSPIIAGKNLYVMDRNGLVRVLATGREYKLIAECPLGEKGDATPAVKGDRLFWRAEKTLFCVGK